MFIGHGSIAVVVHYLKNNICELYFSAKRFHWIIMTVMVYRKMLFEADLQISIVKVALQR